ncbi:Dabb family protein [Streptomyces sp. NPDC101150]|uniref:Dabb family protein n=1 Tax=Streptomyces sp. NPDC101150 TaxID=3366114 RepID=UPI003828D239
MTRWVIFTSASEAAAGLRRAVVRLPGVRACSVGPDLPGSFGGLGLSWDVTADGGLSAVRSLLGGADADAVPLSPVASRTVDLPGPRVKRTLALTVRPGTPTETVARFEADLTAMPDHIATIRSWALSRVDTTVASSRWTHVWEQEFADVEGLTGEYLLHPYHWTYVDRWFDSELPSAVVAPALAHVFRWTDAPVLT